MHGQTRRGGLGAGPYQQDALLRAPLLERSDQGLGVVAVDDEQGGRSQAGRNFKARVAPGGQPDEGLKGGVFEWVKANE